MASASSLIDPSPPLRRNRDFQLLWFGQALSALGSQISGVATPLLILATTGSPAKLGLAGFVGLLPLLLFTLPAGALLDRLPRKRVMLVSESGRTLALTSLAFAVALRTTPYGLILAVLFIEMTGSTLFSVAERTALPQLVSPEQMRAAVSQNQARQYGSGLLGRPLGGFLFSLSRALPFVVDAVSYLISIFSLLLIRKRFEGAERDERRHLDLEIREGLSWLWQQRFLRTISLLVAASDLNVNALYVIVIVLAKKHGASPALIGVILAFIGIGGLAGALIAPRLSARLSIRSAITLTLGTMTALLPLLLVPKPPILFGLMYGAMFVAYPTWSAIHWAYFAELVPDRLQGRVQSAASLLSLGLLPLGVLLAGVALQSIGATATVLALFVMMLLATMVAVGSREIREAPQLGAHALG